MLLCEDGFHLGSIWAKWARGSHSLSRMGFIWARPESSGQVMFLNKSLDVLVESDTTFMFNRAFLHLDYKSLWILNNFRMAGNITDFIIGSHRGDHMGMKKFDPNT